MPVETYLPFWTPVLTSTTAEETEDFSGGCSWIIEKYFYWGSQAASCNALNDREVQLIPMPHQHSSLAAEVFFSVFTVLSYLTIIVPIIMAIAKCVLRCGKDYVITNPHAGENTGTQIRSDQAVQEYPNHAGTTASLQTDPQSCLVHQQEPEQALPSGAEPAHVLTSAGDFSGLSSANLSEPNIPASMSTGEPLSMADMFRLQMQMTQLSQENEARQIMERLLLERRQAALRGVITAVQGL